eukprot:TRINITY_DN28125_c0_g1_i3.p1 TRINITY_DN28125_c0_g1~~TRINITY_DN28125_c0_g1_i3.p1  ORF type:complete len:432 (-),score=66.11 TRINITY_DN28125_c0_g1_i3:68-1363(-)
MAWHVAWAMVLEATVGVAAVSVGWSTYMRALLQGLGLQVSFTAKIHLADGFHFDPLAAGVLVVMACVVASGMRESKVANHVATVLKLMALFLVIFLGFTRVDSSNWQDFAPHGGEGILRGAAVVMFAYTGFEVVAQCAEETREPGWMLPVGLCGSVLAATAVYVLVAVAVSLAVPLDRLGGETPLASAFAQRAFWVAPAVSTGAILGLIAVGIGSLVACSRLLMTLSRDGLLPRCLGTVNMSTRTPAVATCICGCGAFVISIAFPYNVLTEMVSVGTMFALTMVCIALVVSRAKDEQRPCRLPALLLGFVVACAATLVAWRRAWNYTASLSAAAGFVIAGLICRMSQTPEVLSQAECQKVFRVPFGPIIPLLGSAMNVSMMMSLDVALEVNLVWVVLGWFVFFGYSWHNSNLALGTESSPLVSPALAKLAK